MTSSLYTHMQAAVDIVNTGPHPTNKIAATITGQGFALSRVNHWPAAITAAIGTNTKIGNSSGTIHAETACILSAPKTENTSLFVTDPPCPNCMKNIAEAGIVKLYIDHKGFDKDWARRRGDSFESMSMRIAEKAGIDVHIIHRKEERFEIISRHAPGYKPPVENPPEIRQYPPPESSPFEGGDMEGGASNAFKALIAKAYEQMNEEPFAIAIAHDHGGQTFSILVKPHPTIGYTYETMDKPPNKYSFLMEPLNRLLMIAARHGLKINPGHLYSSRTPTARELVNMLGAGLNQIQIGNTNDSRDKFGPKALKQLRDAKILK
ncbi:MAG: deoxycytidylate deaminase [Alphaproteobacteria bacterium]